MLSTALVLGHGAGAPQLSPFITRFAHGLAHRGIDIVTFSFVYMERRRRAPDQPAKLEACCRAVIETTRERVATARSMLIVEGKSMGGRIASQVVAADPDGLGVAGLVFLGYPLHRPIQPVDATVSASVTAGVRYPSVLRGRVLSRRAISSSWAWV